jgi:peroxiredoxin
MKTTARAGLKALGLGMMALALLGAKRPVVDQPAPDFELRLVDGTKIALHDLRGQVVVLNFWATWCVPCKKELPLLDAYYRAQQSHGLRVFAVTTEDSVSDRQLKPLFGVLAIQPVRHLKGPYDILQGVPTNYVIDRAGKVRYAKAGAFELDDLNEVLVPLLKEPAPAD